MSGIRHEAGTVTWGRCTVSTSSPPLHPCEKLLIRRSMCVTSPSLAENRASRLQEIRLMVFDEGRRESKETDPSHVMPQGEGGHPGPGMLPERLGVWDDQKLP